MREARGIRAFGIVGGASGATGDLAADWCMTPDIVAVDWSGRESGAEKAIWLAEIRGGHPVRLECGRDRAGLVQDLISTKRRSAELIVGMDFAFALPSWYLEQRGLGSASELWELAARDGESWLRRCEWPFWGRPGIKRHDLPEHFRRTDLAVPDSNGVRPKSVFQIGGAGAVGTGSIRGMPALRALREAGFSVWPFDEPRLPVVVEIYPRILTGPVVKTSPSARRAYLTRRYPELDPGIAERAQASEDAFDALVSALVMHAHVDELLGLAPSRDPAILREGWIWWPREAGARPDDAAGSRADARAGVAVAQRGGGEAGEESDEELLARLHRLAVRFTDSGQDPYRRSYETLLRFFECRSAITADDVILGAHLVYAWMPCVLAIEPARSVGDAAALLERARAGDDLGPAEIGALAATLGNSVVAASKLLHFVAPSRWPIWDRNVRKGFGISIHRSDVASYLHYVARLRRVSECDAFAGSVRRVSDGLGYEVSPLRAAELLLFEAGRAARVSGRLTVET
jgi:hypothetical protein